MTTTTAAVRDFVSVLSGEDVAGGELASRMRALLEETKAAGDSASSDEGSEDGALSYEDRDQPKTESEMVMEMALDKLQDEEWLDVERPDLEE
jgi:hypothetical protein